MAWSHQEQLVSLHRDRTDKEAVKPVFYVRVNQDTLFTLLSQAKGELIFEQMKRYLSKWHWGKTQNSKMVRLKKISKSGGRKKF